MEPRKPGKIHLHCLRGLVVAGWLLGLTLTPVWAQARKAAALQAGAEAPPKTEARNSPRALFSDQERALAFLGTGNPVAQLLVVRELNRAFPLSPRQRGALQALAREAQPFLQTLREKRGRQERALEEAIYGETFDAKAVEPLVNEAAETQRELLKRQAEVETRVVRLLAQENRMQARYYMLLSELVVGPKRNQVPAMMLITRQFTGQWRFLHEMFGEDMDMLIPSFSNPLSVLLVLRQLDLSPEQKAAFKALAQEVRAQLLEEREPPNAAAQRDAQARNELPPNDRMFERVENRERLMNEVAERQVRMMKRQVHIETRIREILNPKQWGEYTTLLRGMLSGNLAGNPANLAGRPRLQEPAPNLKNLRQGRVPLNNRPFEQQ